MSSIDAVGKNFSGSFSKKKELKLKKEKIHFADQLNFATHAQEKNAINEIYESDTGLDGKKNNDKQLEALLDNVHRSGEKLKESPLLDNISEYKTAIKNFLSYVINSMLKVEEKTSGFNILKRKKFTLIKVIDKKLEDLIIEVLRGQTEQLNMLRKVEEINGLVIDLLT